MQKNNDIVQIYFFKHVQQIPICASVNAALVPNWLKGTAMLKGIVLTKNSNVLSPNVAPNLCDFLFWSTKDVCFCPYSGVQYLWTLKFYKWKTAEQEQNFRFSQSS